MPAVTVPDPAQPGQGREHAPPQHQGPPGLFLQWGSRLQEGKSWLFGVLGHSASVVPGCGKAPGWAVCGQGRVLGCIQGFHPQRKVPSSCVSPLLASHGRGLLQQGGRGCSPAQLTEAMAPAWYRQRCKARCHRESWHHAKHNAARAHSQTCSSWCCRMGWAAEGWELSLGWRAGEEGRAQRMPVGTWLVTLHVTWSVGSSRWTEESPVWLNCCGGLYRWELSTVLCGRDVMAQAGT